MLRMQTTSEVRSCLAVSCYMYETILIKDKEVSLSHDTYLYNTLLYAFHKLIHNYHFPLQQA